MKYQPEVLARLDATKLKFLALLLMVVDHVGLILFPYTVILRWIGRLSLPIWAFCVAESVKHTRSPLRYALRLLLFAVISEPFYDLGIYGRWFVRNSSSIFFTLLFGALACLFASWMHKGEIPWRKLPDWLARGNFTPVVCFLLLGGVVVLSLFFGAQYGVFGVLMVLIFYLYGDNLLGLLAGCAVPNFMYWYSAQNSQQWLGVFAFLPLSLYNGKRGSGRKWFFYVFYPLHLFLLRMIYLGFFA